MPAHDAPRNTEPVNLSEPDRLATLLVLVATFGLVDPDREYDAGCYRHADADRERE